MIYFLARLSLNDRNNKSVHRQKCWWAFLLRYFDKILTN